jgi:hypothetical protein
MFIFYVMVYMVCDRNISIHNLARILIRINLQWMEKISARTLCACHGLVGLILGVKTFKSEHAVSALDIKGWPFWGEHTRKPTYFWRDGAKTKSYLLQNMSHKKN